MAKLVLYMIAGGLLMLAAGRWHAGELLWPTWRGLPVVSAWQR